MFSALRKDGKCRRVSSCTMHMHPVPFRAFANMCVRKGADKIRKRGRTTLKITSVRVARDVFRSMGRKFKRSYATAVAWPQSPIILEYLHVETQLRIKFRMMAFNDTGNIMFDQDQQPRLLL